MEPLKIAVVAVDDIKQKFKVITLRGVKGKDTIN